MSTLAPLLAQEIVAVRDFVALLETEREILVAGAIDQLGELAERKAQLALALNAQEKAREALFRQLGVTPKAEAIDAWFGTQEPALLTQWQELMALARSAREANALNGKLINTRMQINQEALDILLSAGESINTYGPDGQQRGNGSSSRSLGSA